MDLELNTAIAHLRHVLGDQAYESLARKGETMTTAAMVTYAYDQIDQARAELNASRNRAHMTVAAGVGVAGGGPRSGLFQLGVNGSIDLGRLLERSSNDDGRGMVVLWWRVSHDNDLSLR